MKRLTTMTCDDGKSQCGDKALPTHRENSTASIPYAPVHRIIEALSEATTKRRGRKVSWC
jgi:hypothetical protein